METSMLCRQCEQASQGKGCVTRGVCGKDPAVLALQDLLVCRLEGISFYGKPARELGIRDKEVDLFVMEGLFTTVTNVDFDPERLQEIILRSSQVNSKIKKLFLEAYKEKYGEDCKICFPEITGWIPASSLEGLVEQGIKAGILAEPYIDEDIRSLRELLLYGLKGMAAYAAHALILGEEDEDVTSFFYEGLAALKDDTLTVDDMIALVMKFGKVNLKCMELLDRANTGNFGNPAPTKVILGIKKGPAIIVSGHDLYDLKQILEQTEGKGINIYTHSEMLPAHGYPELKKYKHLAGHFGSAWQNQQKEFDGIPAVFLFTTNCIQKPRDSYKDHVFTTGLVAWPGVEHIYEKNGKKDFGRAIKKSLELGGFKENNIEKEILVGFAHHTVLSLADKVIEAVKSGKIRRFFLIGGCDGAKPGRNYYTEFALQVPMDCVILTLACGKFRFNRFNFGDIGGIPRLLDCGQCNDAYSAIKIAGALADALGAGINELPLSLILSWYEQKAICILITLLSLGIKDIRLGPSLPAFVSPNVLKVLVEKFGLRPITVPDADLKDILD
jgi:hydroxylamine reductase